MEFPRSLIEGFEMTISVIPSKARNLSLDVELIILGGSVRSAYPYFSKAMWRQIKTLAFQKSANSLRIEISELENSGILGAASLYRA